MAVFAGVINDRLWPLVPLLVSGARSSFWGLIDSGFEGYLMVPDHERGRLGVSRTALMMEGMNADGTTSLVPQGRVILDWFGSSVTVRVHVPPTTMVDGETYRGDPIVGILGLYMLQGMRMTVEFYPDRAVTIDRAP